METRFAGQKVRWDLVQWGQHQAPPIQARCMAVAFDLTCLASNPDNLALRRDTMKRIARLKEAVRTENTESASGNWSQNDTRPRQQYAAEHRPSRMGPIASSVLAFATGLLFIVFWNSTMANRSEPTVTGSVGTVDLAPPPTGSGFFSWVTRAN